MRKARPYSRKVLRRVQTLYEAFLAGELAGPEKHEVHPKLPIGSRENYLYFTLPCSLNFQRSSPALWSSALATFEDPETTYLFFPERVNKVPEGRVKRDLVKHRLALQTNRHPAIWLRICQTLENYYHNDPREILREADYDVRWIIRNLQKEKKALFPYLGGAKLSNYWLFILSKFTNAKLKYLEELSIVPDTHVTKSTIRLGLARKGARPPEVEQIWRSVLRDVGIPPAEMHSALWRWSRSGFRLRIQ